MTKKSTPTAEQINEVIKNKIAEKILEYKVPAEANVIGSYWKNPDFYISHKLQLNHFDENMWRVYYVIGEELSKEGKRTFTDTEVGVYLEKHPKLKKEYEDSGGFQVVEEMKEYCNTDNIDGYINEFNKWWAIGELNKKGLLNFENLKKFIDMTSAEVYDYFQKYINHIFVNVDSDVKSYNICDGSALERIILEANEGKFRGIPLNNCPMSDDAIGGFRKGEITMLAGLSGSGKSTTMIEWLFPTMIKYNEKMVIMLNEQDEKKAMREMLTWVINNVIYKPEEKRFNKKRFVQGKFTKEELEDLMKAKDYLDNLKEKRNLTVIPLQKYHVDTVVRLINKYSAMGCNYFVLDTFKPSTGSGDKVWHELTQDSVKIYDAIKEATNNVGMWINLQLTKESVKYNYLTMYNIGQAKNVVDVASTLILMRPLHNEEKAGGKRELEIFTYGEKINEHQTKEIHMVNSSNHDNHVILFFGKVREGDGKSYQIVVKNSLGYNTIEEVGMCYVPENDW